MKKYTKKIRSISLRSISLLILLYSNLTCAQEGFLPLSNFSEQRFQSGIYQVGSNVHSALKPYLLRDIKTISNYDTIEKNCLNRSRFSTTLVGRKLFNEHLFSIEEDEYALFLSPVVEFLGGQDNENNKNYFTNSRGVWTGGRIGKKFSFNATFYENQSKFPSYLDTVVDATRIVPGSGRIKRANDYDYAWATGSIHYTLNNHFAFSFGNDKHFIGDGYRSLLLSDNAFNYPSLKIVTNVWKIQYTNIFAEMQDLTRIDQNDNEPFARKYTSMHFLDLKLGKRAVLGIFEAVVWHGDSTGNRGFDLGYMNPFIFFRPVEFSIGSPDNVLLGLNFTYKISSHYTFYSQFMLDEFLLEEVKANNGWWANKQGWQFGLKGNDVLGVKNLYAQLEYNAVRPFTYSHRDVQGNYGHYRQALAHPLGANFQEVVGILRYNYKAIMLEGKLNYAEIGKDTGSTNIGQNIFLPYGTRSFEYNNKIGQGEKHQIMWMALTINYQLNCKTHLSVFLEPAMRTEKYNGKTNSTLLLQGGIKTRLFNRYYDF